MMAAPRTRGPASESLQWRKPREVGRDGASDTNGDLTAVVPECEYNFSDIGTNFANGGKRFSPAV